MEGHPLIYVLGVDKFGQADKETKLDIFRALYIARIHILVKWIKEYLPRAEDWRVELMK